MTAPGIEPDHIAIAAESLDAGAAWLEGVLGVPLAPGGRHAYMGTHNRLLGLGAGFYLELIAIDPDAPKPPHPRWFGLDGFAGPPRLVSWVARTGNLDAALAAAPRGAGRPVDLERGDFRWRMGVAPTGHLPFDDCFPALIEWQGGLHPSGRLPDSGCRLVRLTLSHPEPAALSASLAGALGLDDPRVCASPGPPGLAAEIATPGGVRVIG